MMPLPIVQSAVEHHGIAATQLDRDAIRTERQQQLIVGRRTTCGHHT